MRGELTFGGGVYWGGEGGGGIFPGGGMSKFLTGERDFPPSSKRGKLCEVI